MLDNDLLSIQEARSLIRAARKALETFSALDQAGGSPGDLVYSKTYVTDVGPVNALRQARLDALVQNGGLEAD